VLYLYFLWDVNGRLYDEAKSETVNCVPESMWSESQVNLPVSDRCPHVRGGLSKRRILILKKAHRIRSVLARRVEYSHEPSRIRVSNQMSSPEDLLHKAADFSPGGSC